MKCNGCNGSEQEKPPCSTGVVAYAVSGGCTRWSEWSRGHRRLTSPHFLGATSSLVQHGSRVLGCQDLLAQEATVPTRSVVELHNAKKERKSHT